jgi:murein DD-endopeptidase MepM/ murein hydrolase activator NlpD
VTAVGAVGAGTQVVAVAAVAALAVGALAAGRAAGGAGPDPRPSDGRQVTGAAVADRAATASPTGALVYRAPLAGVVERPFDAPDVPWGPGHRGVDLSAEVGAAVGSPADGIVTFAGTVVDRGVVTVTHPDGRRSSLEPVAAVVQVGDRVAAGDVVGTVQGVPGHCAPRTCLHWGVREGDRYVDPLGLLPGHGPVVLLPDR